MVGDLSLEDRVQAAKHDKDELNRLIEEYKPFIASTSQKKVKHFLSYGKDDELTIGLMAFKEAVIGYNSSKGKFLPFAKHVINLRLIDYYRSTKTQMNEVIMPYKNEEQSLDLNPSMQRQAIEHYNNYSENELRKLEIIEYKKELDKWGIKLEDLIKTSPKQKGLRDIYKEIALLISQNEELKSTLIRTQRLPLKKIEENIAIHPKKLERGRVYIIALVVALSGNFEYIKEYINWR